MNLLKKNFNFKKNVFNNKNIFNKKINLSFEFFPPSKNKINKSFWIKIKKLSLFNPKFISVTYGENNGNRLKTYNFVNQIRYYTNLDSVPHMTCVYENKTELKKTALKYLNLGIKHIIALRGDYLEKSKKPNLYALDLVVLLKKIANFDISVAAYPEVHPEAKSAKFDLLNLKKKIDSGASQAITQFFFDIENFLRFRDKCSGIGINAKIIPGILPIYNFNQVYKFCLVSNIYVPEWLKSLYLKSNQNNKEKRLISMNISINMINELYKEGVYDFHLYTLNKLNFIFSLCNILKKI
ncbi:MAG: 5,10-methylenetetrahydrofolate reductase [Buchnera aphidicola (Periphyllus lyropictus)]|uniref:methylenetetrahydrofolate reductase n=1 Tax=Buchnera aphidicola TaxID=9 RepID=UPI001EC0D395|nr:methylenetetrahydrofolate reductase [Buchnera aphidicola]NIH16768.1 5,10-methylenetetrahydrofolate reductase [Buchnera aphidicola (Periphyllus lyropictus)]USS94668.1 methylenetetrahydrofolate reductase [Buchnera aphidicola (Periphyllus lyropictus)]